MKLDLTGSDRTPSWNALSEGWQHLRQSASGALTWFKPEQQEGPARRHSADSAFYVPPLRWSMLGADVFEDDDQVIVRVEVPGMDKDHLSVEVQDGALIVAGSKRMERTTRRHYHMLQCAYGDFRRTISLPVAVRSDQASATYKHGVLIVELPKAQQSAARVTNVRVN